MYIIYVNTKYVSFKKRKKKPLTFMRVKGLKLYPLLSFKAPEQYNFLKTGRDYYIAVSV